MSQPISLPSRGVRLWRGMWMLLAAAGMVALIATLVQPARQSQSEAGSPSSPNHIPTAVEVGTDDLIFISTESPLQKHLGQTTLAPEFVRFPALTVSGSILAKLRTGDEPLEDRWQFSGADLATTYGDWLRTKGEVEFARSQLSKTHELVMAQTAYLEANLKRLEPLWKNGNVPEKDYKAAQADLLKAQLQGEKDIFSAESTLRTAQKTFTALERDLAQNGIEPIVFSRAVEHMVLVSANVPETKISQVREGQGCLAKFYAYPDRKFDAHVELLSSLLTHERRTLRVLFELSDPDGVLRPGMFAEVGLGTDDREALLIPGDSLLHIQLNDYVIVQVEDERWKPVKVRVGEQYHGNFEVLEGLGAGETIISRGAILLKPSVIQVLRRQDGAKPKADG